MKERHAVPLWLLDSGLILLAVLGALDCLASSFGIAAPTWLVLVTVLLTPLLNLLFRLKHGRWFAVGALIAGLALILWPGSQVLGSLLRLWEEVAGYYIKAYAWISEFYNKSEGEISYLPGLTAVVVGQIYVCCLSLSRFRRALPCVLAVLVTLGACFVLLDTPPAVKPFLVTVFALTALILTQNVRRRVIGEAFSAGLWAAALAGLLLSGIVLLWPYEGYEPPLNWENLAEGMAKVGARIENRANVTAGLSGSPNKVELDNLPWLPGSALTELYVTASESGYLYLRGMAYDDFDGESWRVDKSEDWSETCLLPGVDSSQGVLNRISIETTRVHDVIYTPYPFCGELPEGGRVVSDAYVANGSRLKEYRVRAGELRQRSDVDYYLWVEEHCLQVPEETKRAVLDWWADYGTLYADETNGIERYQAAQIVAAAVSNVAKYSRRPDKCPKGRDFCDWFLNDAESGYCVHYATVTVALLRSLGIPARYATGYVCGARADQRMSVTSLHAHAWPEVFAYGQWLPVEPTPSTATEFSGSVSAAASPESDSRPQGTEETVRPTFEPHVPEEPEDTEFMRPERPMESRESAEPTEPTAQNPGTESGDPQPGPGRFRLPAWAWYVLGLLGLLTAVVLQRRVRRACFFRRLRAAPPNEGAALIWRRYERMCRLTRTVPDGPTRDLARKAAFSQHELTDEELRAMRARLERQEIRLRVSRWYKALWFRYGLALI